ncbi:MAG: TonB-dependent receptor, partial [Calditrichaeota bacterium]
MRFSAIGTLVSCLLLSAAILFAQDRATITGVVKDARTGEPLPGANISVQGALRGTASGRDGAYSLKLKPGSYTLLVQYIGFKTVQEKIQVAAGQTLSKDFSLEEDVLQLSEVVTTGTRRFDRTVVSSPVPIDVIPARDLKQGGLTETNQIVEMLVPSFNFPRPTINDGTDHVRPATLRGLNPDQTLVLVNGKRRHTSALLNVNGSIGRGTSAVDLNSIPSNAIERIEVLRDGAAAQYGSDAIAGVINVILKSDAESRISSTLGQTSHGDGEVAHIEGDYGIKFRDTGFFHVSGEFRHRNPTNRSGRDPRQQYFSQPDGSPDPREFTFNRKNHRYGDAEVYNVNVFFNSMYPVSENTSIYGFGNIGYRNGESGGFYRRALDNRNVRAIHPDGFLPLIESNIWDASIAVGVKGTLSDWLWDLSTVFGRNSFEFNVNNSVNVSLGTASPTSFDAGTNTYQQSVTTLDLYRDFEVGLPSPLSLALGAVVRVENYQIDAGEEASWIDGGVPVLDGPNAGARAPAGSQVFPGFRPSDERDETRTNEGIYADIETSLLENLMVGVAGRFENYSDFGSTLNGKLTLRYEPVKNYAIRGAVSSGFRAPSLQQSFYSTTATVFIDGEPFEIRTFPVDDPAARALGSKDLDSETSINVSAGVAFTPITNLAFTADFYHIEINDRITLSENFTG